MRVCGLLGVLFVAFKLANIITWSWMWILAPFWIPFATAVVLLITGAGLVLTDR